MTGTVTPLHISLADIALLAQVKRPVVSMWRKRSKGAALPFPEPVAISGNQELFNAFEMAEWLTATGRGNNPEAAQDLAAFAVPTGPNLDTSHFNAVTALLALRSLTGSPVSDLSEADLLDAADEQDPDDTFLYSELEALGGGLVPLAKYTDLLVDAAYSAPAAFERLMAGRFRVGLREESLTALTDTAIRMVAAIAVELSSGEPQPVFADATPGGSDLLVGVADLLHEGQAAALAVGNNDDGAARLGRRRLRLHAAHRDNLRIKDAAGVGAEGPIVHVAQFPSPAQPELSPEDLLTAVDDIVLRMDDSQRAVVIGPAAVLADAASSRRMEDIRSDVLRSGRVRAIVKLPQGLLKSKPRQAQALWVLGPAHQDVPIGERWTMTADLSNVELDQAAVQDLVSDMAAAMGNRELVRAHSFRFARLVLTHALLAGRGALTRTATTPRSNTLIQAATAAEDVVRAERLVAGLNSSDLPAAPLGLMVETASSPSNRQAASSPARSTIGQLLKARHLVYIPGTRVDEADVTTEADGGSRVFGMAELHGGSALGERWIDRLVFAANHPRAQLTEPGDIVFCTGAKPAALVDKEGSAVVIYPARVVRISTKDPGGLLPELLAADINAAPAGNWRNWAARTLPAAQRAPLAAALAELNRHRRAAEDRLARLNDLTDLLMDGASRGRLAVVPPETSTEGTP